MQWTSRILDERSPRTSLHAAVAPAATRHTPRGTPRSTRRSSTLLSLLASLTLVAANGCLYSRYATNTDRSATEQLLVAESIRRAIGQLDLPDLEGRTAAVRIQAIPSADTDYLRAVLEARLGLEGSRLVPEEEAEFVVTALVGAIGTVARNASFGVPALPIPSLGATPEIPFVSVMRQRAYTEAQIVTHDRGGILVAMSDKVLQRARFDVTSVIFIEFRSNDVYPDEEAAISVD